MDMKLSPEQVKLRSAARELAETEFASKAAKIDRTEAYPFDNVAALKAYFPADAGSFNGPENGSGAGQTSNGRPDVEPYGFTIWVRATTTGGAPRTGEDRRNAYLHRDQDMLPGFPRQLPGDGESSPLFADLDGDNRNELVFATADGVVHAMRPDGSELPGWPAHGDSLPLHSGERAFTSGEVAGSERR